MECNQQTNCTSLRSRHFRKREDVLGKTHRPLLGGTAQEPYNVLRSTSGPHLVSKIYDYVITKWISIVSKTQLSPHLCLLLNQGDFLSC